MEDVIANLDNDWRLTGDEVAAFVGRHEGEASQKYPREQRMIGQRQVEFRNEYRSRILGWYDGYFHIAIIYAMGAAAFYIYVAHIHHVTALEWLTVPADIPVHQYFRMGGAQIRHAPADQHQRPARDLRAAHAQSSPVLHRRRDALSRSEGLAGDGVSALCAGRVHPDVDPAGRRARLLLSPNVGWLFMSTTTGMYLVYEFMHFCCHVDENAFVRHCPFVNTLRRHHTAHHNARLMMEVNMNLTFPIADWIFGTSDLDRGLVGTLLNGYDTRHLKKNLRGAPKRPDEAAAAPVGAN